MVEVETLDARGLRCPEPLMLVRNRIRQLAAGDQLYVLATDPASVRDFEQFCRFLGHRIVEQQEEQGEYRFLFEKAGDRARQASD